MSINTGGSAFPQNTQIVAHAGQVLHTGFMGGMTLRDYFAAKAMTVCPLHQIEDKADWAYRMADAMLKARGQT